MNNLIKVYDIKKIINKISMSSLISGRAHGRFVPNKKLKELLLFFISFFHFAIFKLPKEAKL